MVVCWAALAALVLTPLATQGSEPPTPPSTGALVIAPYLVTPTRWPSAGELTLRRLDAAEETALRFPAAPREPRSLALPPGSVWEISGDVPGFWVRRTMVTIGTAERPEQVRLGLWPLGRLTGQIKGLEPAKLPRSVRLTTLAPPAFLQRPPVPPGSQDCPVIPDGTWVCSLPAATYDLVAVVEPFVPVYFWGIAVKAGETGALGTLELKPGASIAGWVTVEGGQLGEGCIARAEPAVAGGASPQAAAGLARKALERPVRKDGFFQLTGLPPGMYVVEILQPGFTAARVPGVQVAAGTETFFRDPLVLTKPVDLVFEITPPLDWLGRPWQARISRARSAGGLGAATVFQGSVGPEGRLEVPGQPAGRFEVKLSDSLGNGMYFDDRHLFDPATAEPQTITLDLVDLTGTLRLGSNGVRGTLWFGGRQAALSVKLEADQDGHFAGVLPRGGFWIVETELTEPVVRTLAEVEVNPNPAGLARLSIDIPETKLFGRVVDESGKPVERAFVTVESEEVDQNVPTGPAGEFEVRGFPEGRVRVGAGSPQGSSEWVYTSVADGMPAGPVELQLRKLQHHTGVLTSPVGPVAGARILVSPFPSTGGAATATTGADGSFAADIPAGHRQVTLLISAPGHAFKAMGPLDVGALAVSLNAAEAGSLVLTLPEVGSLRRGGYRLNLFADGLLVPVGVLRQWAADQGLGRWGEPGTLELPQLSPGVYAACLQERRGANVFASPAPEAGLCVAGTLSPGGTLALSPRPAQ